MIKDEDRTCYKDVFAMSADHTNQGSQPSPEVGRRLRRGDVVHVKPGSPHPIYTDLPMGGWSGTIEQTQKQKHGHLRRCWVRFFKSTTDRLHPVYEDRERRDNEHVVLWDNWVLAHLLELGEVSSEAIEQPHLPAWAEKAGDRQVRALFGLEPDEPYPDCAPETWQTWHRFLSDNIRLPRVLAEDMDEDGEVFGERQMLERLLLPDDLPADYPADEDRHGVYGEITGEGKTFAVPLDELKLPDEDPLDNLLRDYTHWFDALHGDSDSDDDFGDDIPFGMSREEFERLWNSVRNSAFKPDARIVVPDETDLETAMASLDRTSLPTAEEPPDYDARPEPIRTAPRAGRNDPCPCGSGKKYKKCCLRSASDGT
jgi:hypothetical protein